MNKEIENNKWEPKDEKLFKMLVLLGKRGYGETDTTDPITVCKYVESILTSNTAELKKKIEGVKVKGYMNQKNRDQAKLVQEIYDEFIKPAILSELNRQ